MDKHIHTPITEEITADLKAGDYVYITGTLYVARDAAHKRMMEVLDEGKELPINIKDCTIYYMGPSPAKRRTTDRFCRSDDRQAVWTNTLRVCWILVKKP